MRNSPFLELDRLSSLERRRSKRTALPGGSSGTLADSDRIALFLTTAPIPLILQIHLQLLLLVYVGAVPLQLVRTIGVWCIPATAISAAVFFGIDRAAEELSDPFGEEPNDLPVGRFCADLHREYLEMLGEGGGSAGNAWEPDVPVAAPAEQQRAPDVKSEKSR